MWAATAPEFVPELQFWSSRSSSNCRCVAVLCLCRCGCSLAVSALEVLAAGFLFSTSKDGAVPSCLDCSFRFVARQSFRANPGHGVLAHNKLPQYKCSKSLKRGKVKEAFSASIPSFASEVKERKRKAAT